MKISCTCGHRISDTTEGLRYKGHLMSDTVWLNFWDAIDAAVEQSGPTAKEKEAACMQLRKWWGAFRLVWECTDCGRVYVDSDGGRLKGYVSELGAYEGATRP